MNSKFKNIINSFKKLVNLLFGPLLGYLSLTKEKRISVELSQNNIKICKINPSGKKILKIIDESFDFEKKINFEENPDLYSEKIREIFKNEKLLNYEVTVIIPTAEVEIKNLKIPLLSDFDLLEQSKDPLYWSQFDETIDLADKVLAYQKINTNKELNEDELVIAITDKKKIEFIYNILKSSGVNPNIFEPKCFGNLNAIINSRKIL